MDGEKQDIIIEKTDVVYGDTDSIEIIPSNGSALSYDLDPFGKIKSVSVNKGGRFTELPRIKMNTETGLNAAFVPNFSIIRDPQPVDPVITQEDLVQVFDLVGLNINGYIDGKPVSYTHLTLPTKRIV